MIVMVLESVPVGLRGELTRWLIEPHPGVFVGHVSGAVRDRLWLKCCQGLRSGGVVQLWSTNNEQRFAVRAYGATKREIVDYEGLQLIRLPVDPSPSVPEGNVDRQRVAQRRTARTKETV
jgi:CRISPR-associated protein Cas2